MLHAADDLKEETIGEFFGFTEKENRFAVDQAEKYDYIERQNGLIRLTDAGHNLFPVGSDEPALFEVQPRNDRFDFGLVAFAPADAWRQLSTFEHDLPELAVASAEAVGEAGRKSGPVLRQTLSGVPFETRRRARRAPVSLHRRRRAGREAIRPCRARQGVGERRRARGSPEADLLAWNSGFDLDGYPVPMGVASFDADVALSGFGELKASDRA